MTRDSLGNSLQLDDAASLSGVNDFVAGFITSQARVANLLLLAHHERSAIVQAYCAALHMFAESPDGAVNARSLIANALAQQRLRGQPQSARLTRQARTVYSKLGLDAVQV